MDLINVVKSELERNPDVVVVTGDPYRTDNLTTVPYRRPYSGKPSVLEGAHFYIAPKTGISDPEQLNEFMDGLVEGLDPKRVENFRLDGSTLKHGKLIYEHAIGAEEEITDDLDGRGQQYLPMELFVRRVEVSVFPNEALARAWYSHHPHEAPRGDDIRRVKLSVFLRNLKKVA